MTPTQIKITGYIVVGFMLFASGFAFATYRHRASIAEYGRHEQERMVQIAMKEAEQNQLRGENKQLREHVAKLSADDEALKAIIESRGGAIANEAKNLEKINEDLKNDVAVISNPTDKCLRCRKFSERAVAAGQIGRPLTCKDECAGSPQ